MLDKKASFRSKCQKDKVTGNDFEIVFRAYLCQKCINFRETKNKVIVGPFCTSSNIFHSFCDDL